MGEEFRQVMLMDLLTESVGWGLNKCKWNEFVQGRKTY